MENHIFRTAIGGFNRQDVTDYIERTRKQAEETAAALEKQAEELRTSLSGTQTALDESRSALEDSARERDETQKLLEAVTAERDQVKQNWDVQVMAAASARREMEQREETIRALTEEKKDLTLRVRELESGLESLRQEKERLAQMELDARRRSDEIVAQADAQAADAIAEAGAKARDIVAQAEAQAAAMVNRANARAEDLLRQAEERIAGAAGQYNELHRSFEAITSHITSELRRLDVAAGQLPISFNHLKEGLSELLERAKER